MILTITVDAPDTILLSSIDSYALAHGWTQNITDSNGQTILNPITSLKYSQDALLRHFFRNDFCLYH